MDIKGDGQFMEIIDCRAHERDHFGFEVARSRKLGLVRSGKTDNKVMYG